MKSSSFIPCFTLIAAALALAACQQQQPEPEAQGAADGQVQEPDGKPGLAVSDGVLVLPAVKGNPGVAYFALSNTSGQPTSLAAVSVEGAAKAEMHETRGGKMEPMNWTQVNAGETVRFERGGKHVMVFGLAETIAPGGTAEMTLTFSGGDKLSTPLRIESVGGEGADKAH